MAEASGNRSRIFLLNTLASYMMISAYETAAGVKLVLDSCRENGLLRRLWAFRS